MYLFLNAMKMMSDCKVCCQAWEVMNVLQKSEAVVLIITITYADAQVLKMLMVSLSQAFNFPPSKSFQVKKSF